jgi:FkbM family methyltransferase
MKIIPKLIITIKSAVRRQRLNFIKKRPRNMVGQTRMLGDVFFYPDAASFVSTYESIYIQNCYHFYSSKSSPRILDCGANTGLATLYFKKIYPNSRITAFEPDPEIAACFRKNLSLKGINDVELVEAAVWKKDGQMTFLPDGADGGALSASGSGITVNTVDLRRWMYEPIDFLKMDIEGAEIEVFDHCADQLGNVKNIAVEYHERLGQPQYLDKLLSILSKAEFKYHIFSKGGPVKPLANRFGPKNCGQMLDIFACRV